MGEEAITCTCSECRARARKAAGGKCLCCDGTGTVPSIVGELRPCSRCAMDLFDRWCKERMTGHE